MTARRPARFSGLGDLAGMAASGLCLVHCLAAPLAGPALAAALPVLGLTAGEEGHDGVHAALLAAIALPVLLSLLPGYLRHRDNVVLALGVAGLGSFVAALCVLGPLFGHALETAGAVLSGVLLMAAHFLNRRRGRKRAPAARGVRHPAPAPCCG